MTAHPPFPPGYRGPVYLPGTGRVVWWTGKVLVGLRYREPRRGIDSLDAEFIQRLLLSEKR